MYQHILCFVLVVTCSSFDISTDVEKEFRLYIENFEKHYKRDTDEYIIRLRNFNETLSRLLKYNTSGNTQYGLTQFSDWSSEDFMKNVVKTLDGKYETPMPTAGRRKRALNVNLLKDIPDKIDWRNHNTVTGVKNQKNCGACWAFSTIETIESMLAMKTGVLQELSVQQVIDCAEGGNYGCNGGDTCNVLTWMYETNFSSTTEQQYPLTDISAKCELKAPTKVQIYGNFTCNSYVGKEEEMLQLLATHGPLVTAVDATTWQDYIGGIIQYHCDTRTNHAVQIVGYDLTGNKVFSLNSTVMNEFRKR